MSFLLSKSNESDDKATSSAEQIVENETNSSNFSGLANKLWETGKRRFSTSDNTQVKVNVSNQDEDTKDIDKELDPVDEESYEQAAQLLKESTNQVSVNYESIQASNANIYTADKTQLLPGLDILPRETLHYKITKYINSYFASDISNDDHRHLIISKDNKSPPKKIVLIGVHGFFPHPNIRKIIGNPTGTSHRFIQEAEKSIKEYYKENTEEVEMFSIALEKEGKVFERVDHFYEVLTENEEYLNQIDSADMVYFVAHSQGCPTSIILLAKLLQNGIIGKTNIDGTNKKIGILCMAGIMNGPVYYKDRYWFTKLYFKFEGDRLLELFHFQNFDSIQMKMLQEAMEILISYQNCKVCFVGSLTDQLVPLYSSCCYFTKSHPNVFRSCYIDNINNNGLYKKKFLIEIVRISLKLLNLGYTDNKMLLNISQFLIGKMSGKGHSSLYYDPKVYLLGFRFIWETSNITTQEPLSFHKYHIEKLDFTNKLNTEVINKRLIWSSLGFLGHLKQLSKKHMFSFYSIMSFWAYGTHKIDDTETPHFHNDLFSLLDKFWNWNPEVTDKDMTGDGSDNNADDNTSIKDLVDWKNGLSELLALNGYEKYKT
ncbi:hypothetical protein FOG51_01086 [Hanseniaspora uvarum]|uniref:YMC020W-like alpha/beta hydrolase domain-containing protein n=1 Tax=Hanseniaspora uvarum TaxID=29833 RepID=A0A1E5RYP2_HANUV|nr:hypothetical protein FOG51_01086 [Hanseniaspora uvarum]KAF0277230.1 hypothetical protein FOG50_01859 [Hanseniaspora uvarum]OEJ92061.1 Uncharacterized protein AWRI3580_g793 [Hanseniaspora uvarum]